MRLPRRTSATLEIRKSNRSICWKNARDSQTNPRLTEFASRSGSFGFLAYRTGSYMKQARTPAQTGFRMPAEWEPHSGCWMAWPTRQRWGNRFKDVCKCVANLARIIARCEPVTMVASPRNIREAVAACGLNVTVLPIPVDDIWIRDTGPTFLLNPEDELAGATWRSTHGAANTLTTKSMLQSPRVS